MLTSTTVTLSSVILLLWVVPILITKSGFSSSVVTLASSGVGTYALTTKRSTTKERKTLPGVH